MGRGGHYVYVINEDGTRSRGQWVSNKTHDKMMESASKQSDLMSQRRRENEEQTAGAIRIPNSNNIPTGNNENADRYKIPQIKMPESALNTNGEYEVIGRNPTNTTAPINVNNKSKESENKTKLSREERKAVNNIVKEIKRMTRVGSPRDIEHPDVQERIHALAEYDDSLWEMYSQSGNTRKDYYDLIHAIENKLSVKILD